MYEQGTDEQLICKKTGHRSIALRSYKCTSSRQLKEVSDMLYGNVTSNESEVKPPKIAKKESTSTVSVAPSSSQKVPFKSENESLKRASNTIEVGKEITLNINVQK